MARAKNRVYTVLSGLVFEKSSKYKTLELPRSKPPPKSVGDSPLMDAADEDAADERLVWHLRNWVAWHRKSHRVGVGYPSRASGGIGQSGSTDFEAMCANSDNALAMAVDALIDDLPQRERQAVYNEWLGTVVQLWGDPSRLYLAGVDKLARGLRARGIW